MDDAHGISSIDYLEKGKTINSEYHLVLLDQLSAEIKKKQRHMQKKITIQMFWNSYVRLTQMKAINIVSLCLPLE